jgi:hypothetical protein
MVSNHDDDNKKNHFYFLIVFYFVTMVDVGKLLFEVWYERTDIKSNK